MVSGGKRPYIKFNNVIYLLMMRSSAAKRMVSQALLFTYCSFCLLTFFSFCCVRVYGFLFESCSSVTNVAHCLAAWHVTPSSRTTVSQYVPILEKEKVYFFLTLVYLVYRCSRKSRFLRMYTMNPHSSHNSCSAACVCS